MIRHIVVYFIFAAIIGCGPHTDEEDYYYTRNGTSETIVYQVYSSGKMWGNMTISSNARGDKDGGGQITVDSVKFLKASKILTFVNPKYDLATYEATKDWNFFNSKNWVQEKQNEFVYTVKEEFFK
jgi:hypothetical protein